MDGPTSPYNDQPGFKERGGASEEASHKVATKAQHQRALVLAALHARPEGLTAPEVFRALRRRVPLNSVRSRLTELSKPDAISGEAPVIKTKVRRADPDAAVAVTVYRAA